MKNFIFISPNFPVTYWKFCAELKNNGLRVLGVGDCPYDELNQNLRDSLDEYYKVGSLENYDEVFKAVAFFTYKYGKIDWLESNNEYWLERARNDRCSLPNRAPLCGTHRRPESALRSLQAQQGGILHLPTAYG